MATVFKVLSSDDVSYTKTLLHENIPITGTIISGTYDDSNVFNYTHGMFQTVFDYPYASSSANNLFDITIGHSTNSPTYKTTNVLNSKKTNVYNELAKLLVGYDSTGSILKFDEDGLSTTTEDKINNTFFLTFSRLLVKDEIKKGTFNMVLALSGSSRADINANLQGTISDASGTTNYRTNSPVGEYGILFLTDVSGAFPNTDRKVGLIFYQAGIVALSAHVFAASSSLSIANSLSSSQRGQLLYPSVMHNTTSSFEDVEKLFASGSIQVACDSLRTRIKNINFQNTTELNSTIYSLRINNGEFNYSSNPTYLSSSTIRVKNNNPLNAPVSYVTTVGLYSSDNELLATAKLSEPLKKTPEQSLLLRVRLDY
jgi:hypothetical protein